MVKRRLTHTKTRVKRKTLTRKLDHAFSLHVRQKYANKQGLVQCFTCPKRDHYKRMQNGHYISRACLVLRWAEDNCRPQCVSCNIFRGGQPITFRENMVKELGEEAVRFLEASRFTIFKVDPSWYEERLAQLKKVV